MSEKKTTKIDKMVIEGITYVPENSVSKPEKVDGLEYCVIRSYASGVFAGYVKERKAEVNGVNVTLINARRLWKWVGASSLSQLAMEGVKKPNDCLFPCEVDSIEIMNVVEIIPATIECLESIKSVKVWKQ
jgi:hypothetical protein